MKVGIIGSGTMGSGIAQVAATANNPVKVYDANASALEKSKADLERILSRLIEKERIDRAEKERIQQNITYVTQLSDLADSELVIEAIVENLDIKHKVFAELETYVSKSCILASNTSSLSIASIGASCKLPERVIGVHFFNPAPLMKLVEIIPAIQTDNDVVVKTKGIIDSWGKNTVIAKDTPGFIVNRVARPFYSESLRIYEEGIADFATIDWAIKEFGGFRMGPFQLMDFIGNDINYTVTETVFKSFYYDPKYKPAFTQKRLMEAGYWGRKSGKGYYTYGEDASRPNPVEDKDLGSAIFERVLVMLINEAADALFWNVASATDIDNAMTLGVNYPKGLLDWADELGMDFCVSRIDALYDEFHEDRYRCSPLLRKMQRDQKTFF